MRIDYWMKGVTNALLKLQFDIDVDIDGSTDPPHTSLVWMIREVDGRMIGGLKCPPPG